MRFVFLHLVLFGVWILMNLPGVPLPHFDPMYVVLAMVASVEAIFLYLYSDHTESDDRAGGEACGSGFAG